MASPLLDRPTCCTFRGSGPASFRAVFMQGGTIGARKEATMHRPMVFSLIVLAVIATLSLGCSQTSSRADTERTAGDAIHDASITARIKTTYLFSGHLNPFRINVDT